MTAQIYHLPQARRIAADRSVSDERRREAFALLIKHGTDDEAAQAWRAMIDLDEATAREAAMRHASRAVIRAAWIVGACILAAVVWRISFVE